MNSAHVRALVGAVLFLCCAFGSELKPVSLDVEGRWLVSLAFLFIVSAQVLFGWEYGVFVGAGAMLVAQLVGRIFGLRLIFNCSVYVIGTSVGALCGSVSVFDTTNLGDAQFAALSARIFVMAARNASFVAWTSPPGVTWKWQVLARSVDAGSQPAGAVPPATARRPMKAGS